MSLADDVQRALDRVQASGSGSLNVAVPPGNLRADLSAVDRVGCSFRELALHTDALQGADTRRLEQCASAIASRLTYLLEPLRVLEIDDQARVVQLRSVPPSQQGDLRSYYEVQVREGGSIILRRFEAVRGRPRRHVDAHVTREVFARLADDLCDIV